mmetsp:Transcript_10343/g.22814  ORF Transcript_10343/g.22814 Transcript_10343/m.22814 type:complete len:142 (-) Transcript_10343:128-553(-)
MASRGSRSTASHVSSRPSNTGGYPAARPTASVASGSSASRTMASVMTPHQPPSRMAMTAVPGYAGYVPGAYSQNVYGSTFRRTCKHAANDLTAGTRKVVLDKSSHLRRTREVSNPNKVERMPGAIPTLPDKIGHPMVRVNK